MFPTLGYIYSRHNADVVLFRLSFVLDPLLFLVSLHSPILSLLFYIRGVRAHTHTHEALQSGSRGCTMADLIGSDRTSSSNPATYIESPSSTPLNPFSFLFHFCLLLPTVCVLYSPGTKGECARTRREMPV